MTNGDNDSMVANATSVKVKVQHGFDDVGDGLTDGEGSRNKDHYVHDVMVCASCRRRVSCPSWPSKAQHRTDPLLFAHCHCQMLLRFTSSIIVIVVFLLVAIAIIIATSWL